MKKYYIMAAVALTAAFTACNNNKETKGEVHAEDERHNHADSETDEDEGHNPDEIVFTEAQAKAIGLEVETVRRGIFHQVIRTSGKVQAAQGDEETIVATSNGILSFVGSSSVEGTAVNRGSVMVTISARNLPEGAPMAKAKIAFEIAKKEYERAQALVKDQIISAKEFEQVRLKYEQTRTTYQAQAANVTKGGGVSVTSPINGYVKNRLVSQGEYVTVGQPIATVSQNRRLQLKADVAESDFNQLRNIKNANFVTSYDNRVYKLDELDGRLLSFGKASDSDSYYIPVTFEFNNVGNIIPGSYVDVYLLGQPEEQVISVPISALTEEQGLYFVYLQVEPEAYLKREVEVLQSDGERVKILSGLQPGDRVVTRGAYQVKLASSSSVIPSHNHEH